MANQSCSLPLLAQSVKTTAVLFSVLHFVFSPVAACGNALVIRALWKASSIPANVKKLFLSLAISDLAVGLFSHLMLGLWYTMVAIDGYKSYVLCSKVETVSSFFSSLLFYASFLTVTAIAVDRLLAISLHLRYRELVTSNRIRTAIISVWVTSGIAASLFISVGNYNFLVTLAVRSVGFLSTTVAYIHIYRVARRHQKQMNCQFQLHCAQAMDFIRENKSAFNALYFYVVFIACHLPHLFSAVFLIADGSRISFWVSFHVTLFLVSLKSSFNPVIYCWRYQEIRQIVKNTVKKIFRIPET